MKSNILIVGDKSGIGLALANKITNLKFASNAKVYGRTPDGKYYEHGYPDVFIESKKLKIDTIIDCGSLDKQLWVHEDKNGDTFMKMMDNNCRKMFQLYHDFIGSLRKQEGIYITIASVSAHVAMSCSSNYCASKAAMVSTMRVMAREEDRLLGDNPNHASIFSISPILIPETPLVKNLVKEYMKKRKVNSIDQANKDFCQRLYNKNPLHLNDVVDFLYYLIFDGRSLARSLSGTDLNLGDQM